MFQYPLKEMVYEHDICQTPYYNNSREPVFNLINKSTYNVCRLENGIRLPMDKYLQNMFESKIIYSPYGFGEYGAPRDVQAFQFGSVLIKPRMDHIQTVSEMYIEDETYIACAHDFHDLEEKTDYVLSNFNELQPYLTENARNTLQKVYSPEILVKHVYNIFKSLKGIKPE
jgi:hypothetical protein